MHIFRHLEANIHSVSHRHQLFLRMKLFKKTAEKYGTMPSTDQSQSHSALCVCVCLFSCFWLIIRTHVNYFSCHVSGAIVQGAAKCKVNLSSTREMVGYSSNFTSYTTELLCEWRKMCTAATHINVICQHLTAAELLAVFSVFCLSVHYHEYQTIDWRNKILIIFLHCGTTVSTWFKWWKWPKGICVKEKKLLN